MHDDFRTDCAVRAPAHSELLFNALSPGHKLAVVAVALAAVVALIVAVPLVLVLFVAALSPLWLLAALVWWLWRRSTPSRVHPANISG